MKRKKVIILGTLGTAALVAATVIPIVLINQKKDEKTVEKDNVVYSNKLKALSEKVVKIIALNTESVTDKKAEILAAIKLLTNFPTLPKGITLEVKDDATKIVSNKEVDVMLIVKKDGETNIEIKGFKVRSFTDQEMVDDYAKKLEAFATKEVQIPSITGTITGKKSEIVTSLKALKDFPKLPNDVTLDVKDDAASLTLQEIPITLIVKKGSVNKEVQGFSAIRSATDQERVDFYKVTLLAALGIFDTFNPNFKYLKIESSSGSVTDNKSAILTKLKEHTNTSFGENNLLSDAALTLAEIELDIKDDSTAITKEGIPIVLQLKKGSAVAEFDGAGSSFQLFVKRSLTNAESITEIQDYLAQVNDKIFIPHSVSTTNAEEILMAVKNVIGDKATDETKKLFTFKSGQPTSLTAGEETSIEYDFGSETFTLLVTKRTSDAQAIIDYFAQSGKKDLSIPNATTISDNNTLTSAIQEALKADDSTLFDDTKKAYVTVAEDHVYGPFTKGVAKNVKVKIQKGSEAPEFIILSVTHFKNDVEIVEDYFSTPGNNKIFIPHSTSTTSNSEILTAVINALGTNLDNDQKTLITLSGSVSLVEGVENSISFGITGGDDVTLLVTKRSADAQAIINYFDQSGKKDLSIPSAREILDNNSLTNAIQETLFLDDPVLFDNTKKLYVTVASDYAYSTLTKGTAKDVKVQIQKGSETPEFITLSIMHNTSDFETVINYFSTNREFFIPHSTRTSSTGEIRNAFSDVIAGELTNSQINLIDNIRRPNPVQSLVDGAKTSITYIVDGGRGEITFSITKRSADAQAIINYFAQRNKKKLIIPSATTISNSNTLTTAIQEALKADDSSLFDDTKKLYVTLPSDYTYSELTQGTAKNVNVKIQKGSETPEFITLSIMHNTAGFDAVNGYFDTNYRFFISDTTPTSNRVEILDALKNAIGDNLTSQQKNLIQIRNNGASSLAPGTAELFEYKIVGGIGGNIVWIVKRSADAQAIIDYFAQAGKKDLSIPSTTAILDNDQLTAAIQEALKADDSALFDDTKKAYVTVANDHVYNAFIGEIAQNIKVKIQVGSQNAEYVTLSVTHLENPPDSN